MSYKIFLVEDDPFLSSLLKTRLTREGFNVDIARDGEEALNKVKEAKPDLVLLDLILPKKSGFEVLEAMHEDAELKTYRTVIISNLGQDSDIERGKQLGAVEYFIKAKTSIDELVERVANVLEAGQPEGASPVVTSAPELQTQA